MNCLKNTSLMMKVQVKKARHKGAMNEVRV